MLRNSSTHWILLVVLATSSCNTVEDACVYRYFKGTCKIITSCPFAMQLLRIKDAKILNQMVCGFVNSTPKVCCPINESIIFNDNDTDKIKNPVSSTINVELTTRSSFSDLEDNVVNTKEVTISDEPRESNVFPSRKVCGKRTGGEDKIVGGELTKIDEFPWMARIKIRKYDKENFSCSGSLITNRHVLTAAHCLKDIGAEVLSVRLGEWDETSESDCFENACNEKPVDSGIEKITVHPSYNQGNKSFDIGIIKLDKVINFTDFIRPICLPTTPYIAKQDTLTDVIYTSAGWGLTEFENVSPVLRKVALPAVPFDICQSILKLKPDSEKNIICAGGQKGRDTCSGDSGGPLMRELPEEYQMNWYLFGITSLGPKACGREGYPGVYTRVTSYMDWIRQNVT